MSDLAATLGFITGIIGLVSAIVGRKKVIENRTYSIHSGQPENRKYDRVAKKDRRWFDFRGIVIFLLVLFYPVGFYALVKNRTINTGWKWFWAIFILLMVLSAYGS